MSLRVASLLLLLALPAIDLRADDGAASIAAGGIVVMKREPRITMAKEVLQISGWKVLVDYDFRNDSDEDITTEVAFPIPDYKLAMEDIGPLRQGFDDFRLWVNGVPTRYIVEARAFLKNVEHTKMLNSMQVDVATFGNATSNDDSPDIQRLSAAQRKQLAEVGLIDQRDGQPNWKVQKKYHWRQTFPAHKIVHIRHEYSPVLGNNNSIMYGMGPNPDPYGAKELKTFCIDGRLHAILQQVADSKDKDAPYSYVDFVLTTANTWKTPIEDFTLIVEKAHEKDVLADYVSFCWDGPVTKIDADHFSAHSTNLIPTKELRIGFFSVERRRF